MFSVNDYNEILTIVGTQKVQNRIQYYHEAIQYYFEKNENVFSNETTEKLAIIYTFYYFKYSKNYIKDFLLPENFSNRYKIAACSTFTIITLALLYNKKGNHKKVNDEFALYLALNILFNFELKTFNIFESYLDSNVGVINDKFDNIQHHHLFYLKNVHLPEGQHLPILFYALFLQSFIQWVEFKDLNANLGLQL